MKTKLMTMCDRASVLRVTVLACTLMLISATGTQAAMTLGHTVSMVSSRGPGIDMQVVNDFHIVLKGTARNQYFNTNDITEMYSSLNTINSWGKRQLQDNYISLYWTFDDMTVDANTPASFGFGLNIADVDYSYDVYSWHWSKDGEQVGYGNGVSCNWWLNNLQYASSLIQPKPPVIPAPGGGHDCPSVELPTLGNLQTFQAQRTLGFQGGSVGFGELAGMTSPANTVLADPGFVPLMPNVPLGYSMSSPAVQDMNYISLVNLSSESGTPLAILRESVTVVPEPATLALLALGGVALIRRKNSL